MKKKDLAPRVARWVLLLEQFDYEVVHRSGEKMRHLDALSRIEAPCCLQVGESITTRLQAAQDKDDGLKAIKKILEEEEYEDYAIENKLLYKGQEGMRKLVSKGMINEIVGWAHNVGHFSVKKTMKLIERDYFIVKLQQRIENYIRNCIPCILDLGSRERKRHCLILFQKRMCLFIPFT